MAHRFWEQKCPRTMLLDIVNKLSVNEAVYHQVPINSDGRALHVSKKKAAENSCKYNIELSFSYFITYTEMWKLRWLIIWSRNKLAADKKLKKFTHKLFFLK